MKERKVTRILNELIKHCDKYHYCGKLRWLAIN